jgi:hypothetical protein
MSQFLSTSSQFNQAITNDNTALSLPSSEIAMSSAPSLSGDPMGLTYLGLAAYYFFYSYN